MADNRGMEFLRGFIIGGAIGTVLALLYAPKSGRETREDLRGRMDDMYEKARDEYEVSLDRARQSYESTLTRLKDLEMDAKNKAAEVEGMMGDLVERGKTSVDSSKSRLKDALHAAKNAFKEEKKDKAEDEA